MKRYCKFLLGVIQESIVTLYNNELQVEGITIGIHPSP